MPGQWRWGMLCVLAVVQGAWAGPPYQTDDPEPVEYQHHELYISWQQLRANNEVVGSLPSIETTYGAAPGLQLAAGGTYAFDSPPAGATRSGLGDSYVGAKYRLLEEAPDRPMVSVYPQIFFPTGDGSRGLGNGKTQLFLPVWLQKNWGAWQLNGGMAYTINHAGDNRNHWFSGVQLQKDLSPQLTLGVELFHNSEQVADQGSSTGFNLGAIYNLDNTNHLLLALGRGLVHASTTNQGMVYAGYLRTW